MSLESSVLVPCTCNCRCLIIIKQRLGAVVVSFSAPFRRSFCGEEVPNSRIAQARARCRHYVAHSGRYPWMLGAGAARLTLATERWWRLSPKIPRPKSSKTWRVRLKPWQNVVETAGPTVLAQYHGMHRVCRACGWAMEGTLVTDSSDFPV